MDCGSLQFEYTLFNTIIFIEIILTFFIGYHTKTKIVLDQIQIAKHYLRTYFIFDLVSCMPVTYFQNFTKRNDESPSAHFLHDLAILRIFTAPRFFKFLNITAEVSKIHSDLVFNSEIQKKNLFGQFFKLSDIKTRIIRLVCISTLFTHFAVCLYKRIYSVRVRLCIEVPSTIMNLLNIPLNRRISETQPLKWEQSCSIPQLQLLRNI